MVNHACIMVTISDDLSIMRPRVTRLGISRSMTVEDNIFSVLGAYFRILRAHFKMNSQKIKRNYFETNLFGQIKS